MDKSGLWLCIAAIGVIVYSVIGYAVVNADRAMIESTQAGNTGQGRTPDRTGTWLKP